MPVAAKLSDSEGRPARPQVIQSPTTRARCRKGVRVHLEYSGNDEKRKEEFLEKLKALVPEARVSTELSAEGEDRFEIQMNHKNVFSKKELKEDPNLEDMVEIAYWLNQGKNFMHMYLCSFVEGGEPNMMIADRKAMPLVKRVMHTCIIS